MKKRYIWIYMVLLVCIFILPTAIMANTSTSKNTGFSLADRQHSLGIDLVRMVDEAQWRGLFNLYYQCSINKESAIVLGLSHGHDVTIVEAAYKFYFKKYFDGPFAQAGASIGDYDRDKEFGFTGAVGYEMSLTRYIVVSGAVEMTIGSMDNPSTRDRDPIFRPILGATFAF